MMYEQITLAKSQAAPAGTKEANKIAELRRHLSPQEQSLFGIGEPYTSYSAGGAPLRVLLRGLAASLATTTLFMSVGLLAVSATALA